MMKNSFGKITIENAHIVSLFLFQYSLVMVLTKFYDPTIIVMGSTLGLVGCSVLINDFRLADRKCILWFFAILILLVVKCFLMRGNTLYLIFMYIQIAFPVLLIMTNGFNYEKFIRFSCKLAYINFFAIALYPFMGEFAYMRFGYGMLLTVIFMYVKISFLNVGRNAFDVILFVGSFGMLLFYGARGAVFSFLLMVAIDRFIIRRKEFAKNATILAAFGCVLYCFSNILAVLQSLASKIGTRTYVLSKLRMQLDSGAEAASSGRFRIYESAIDKIRDNWFFGGPMEIEIDFAQSGSTYAHNLFLQAGLDFGVLGIVVMFLFVMYILWQIWHSPKRNAQCYVLAILFSIAIGRLMFSSIIWRRPEFWMLFFFSLIIHNNGLIKRMNQNKEL